MEAETDLWLLPLTDMMGVTCLTMLAVAEGAVAYSPIKLGDSQQTD